MFKKTPEILPAEKILDIAFKKASKKQVYDKNPFFRTKKTVIARTDSFATKVIKTLERYIKNFPSLENLPSFYQEIIDIKMDIDKLKKGLGAVNWAKKTSQNIYSTQIKFLKKTGQKDLLKKKQKEIYGRISSVVKQIDKELLLLSEAEKMMKNIPDIRDIPTIVIAGYPNVGKSSLLRCLSKAKPKIAEYPFTTKKIYVGHIEREEKYVKKRFQIIDTPGLLDRPISDRNDIEKQAIAALNHLADVTIFVLDPTEICGYPLQEQKKLLSPIKKSFKDAELIIVENKKDVKETTSSYTKLSCKTGEGIKPLIEEIFSYYPSEEEQ